MVKPRKLRYVRKFEPVDGNDTLSYLVTRLVTKVSQIPGLKESLLEIPGAKEAFAKYDQHVKREASPQEDYSPHNSQKDTYQ